MSLPASSSCFGRAAARQSTRWRRCRVGLLAVALAACGREAPPRLVSIGVSPASATLLVGQRLTLTATPRANTGAVLADRPVLWSGNAPAVATVSAGGEVTALSPGSVAITASSDGVFGFAQLLVVPVPVAQVVVSPPRLDLLVSENAPLVATTVDSVGGPLAGRGVLWSSSAPTVASVSATGLVVGLSAGSSLVTASSEGRSATVEVTVRALSGPPTIAALSTATLVPGDVVSVTGSGFGPDIAANQLTIRGSRVPLQSVRADTLRFVVPCLPAGPATVQVATSGGASPAVAATLATRQRPLARGEAAILTTAAASQCNELPAVGAAARYLVVVSSTQTSANALTDIELAGNPPAPGTAVRVVASTPASRSTPLAASEARTNDAHARHLDAERARYPADLAAARRAATRPRARVVEPPAVGDMRTLYYNFNSCADSTQLIRAKVIYRGAHSIIWEDSANTLQSAADSSLATYYARIGQIFDADQFDLVTRSFGDPLRRDPLTDNDGRVHMVFTQRLNGSGAAAYVTGCDAAPRSANRWGSNLGEFFYGIVPTVAGASVTTTAQPPGWFAFMIRTVVHEVKHIASLAARLSNGASAFEATWLEEGTARHAEELWAREALHQAPFKGNHGYGTAAGNGLFCDFNLANATCLANDPLRRPSWGMRRQFNEVRPKLEEPWNWSLFGDASGQSGAIFYNTAWSLVRYVVDRYAASDAAFFSALTNSTTTGIPTLTALAGVAFEQLLGGWGLSLYADDYPGLPGLNPDASVRTWNLRDIYGGLHDDPLWSGSYPNAYPVSPAALPFGAFVAQQTGLRGGAHAYFELAGNALAPQLLELRGLGGTAMPASARVAIMRLN